MNRQKQDPEGSESLLVLWVPVIRDGNKVTLRSINSRSTSLSGHPQCRVQEEAEGPVEFIKTIWTCAQVERCSLLWKTDLAKTTASVKMKALALADNGVQTSSISRIEQRDHLCGVH
jgi:hypothetical protein